jgi:hypothetical protein
MTKSQWLILGGLGSAVFMVFACLCILVFFFSSSNIPSNSVTQTELPTVIAKSQQTNSVQTIQQPTALTRPTTIPLAIPSPSITPSPLPTIIPSPTPTRIVGIIPGLIPATVKLNLQDRGFTCTNAQNAKDNSGSFYWNCQKSDSNSAILVSYYARTLQTVDLIDASITQYVKPDDSVSSSVFGFIATMPYDGAQPDKARDWVMKTLPTIKIGSDTRTTTIGGVKFELSGISSARSLHMGDFAK